MKTLRKMLAAALLTCVLTASVGAGEIHTGGYAPPPPPPDSKGATSEEPGEVITEVIASLLSNLLAVL